MPRGDNLKNFNRERVGKTYKEIYGEINGGLGNG